MPEDYVPKQYIILKDAQLIIEKLKDRYPDKFWKIIPSDIGVAAVENKQRPKKSKVLAKITGLKPPISIFTSVKYIMELYFSDWVNWTDAQKTMVISKQLLHIHEEGDGKLEDHDLKDFSDLVKAFGVDYINDPDLPDLLGKEDVDW